MQTAVMAVNKTILPKQCIASENRSQTVRDLKVKVNTVTVMAVSFACKQAFVLKAKTEETSYAKMNAAEQKRVGSKPVMRRQTAF